MPRVLQRLHHGWLGDHIKAWWLARFARRVSEFKADAIR